MYFSGGSHPYCADVQYFHIIDLRLDIHTYIEKGDHKHEDAFTLYELVYRDDNTV